MNSQPDRAQASDDGHDILVRLYREQALEDERPSEASRQRILDYAAKQMRTESRPVHQQQSHSPRGLKPKPDAANDGRWWRQAVAGVAALGLVSWLGWGMISSDSSGVVDKGAESTSNDHKSSRQGEQGAAAADISVESARPAADAAMNDSSPRLASARAAIAESAPAANAKAASTQQPAAPNAKESGERSREAAPLPPCPVESSVSNEMGLNERLQADAAPAFTEPSKRCAPLKPKADTPKPEATRQGQRR